MPELFETAIVEKRNVLNELRSNNMSLQELRFFSIYLSKIDPWNKDTRAVRFPIDDFQRIMGFGRLNIKQLKASTDSLLCKVVHIPEERGGYTSFTLFKRCRVSRDDNDKWFVEIDASDDALPLMFEFKNKYFKYELWNALRLKSPNQVRMYEILKQYENIGKRELNITELRELLGIAPNEYDRFERFRVRVLDSCQQALKEKTDICYTYERGKVGKGGKWLTIVFRIEKNKEYVDKLSLENFIEQQPKPEPIDIDVTDEDDETKWVKVYGSEHLAELAKSCNYEFNRSEMELVSHILTRIHVPKDELTNSIEFGRIFYLEEKYAVLCAEADKKKRQGLAIMNRFAYFKGILERDTYQPVALD